MDKEKIITNVVDIRRFEERDWKLRFTYKREMERNWKLSFIKSKERFLIKI